MSPLANYLNELAFSLGQQQRRAVKQARNSLISAQQRLGEMRHKRQKIVSSAKRASPESLIHEVAGQLECEIAVAIAEVSALEARMEFAKTAKVRALDYVALTEQGMYACPHCWVQDGITTAIDSLLMASCAASPVETYECPACNYKFTVDYTWLVQVEAYRPQGQSLPL
jgi:hypothetical protein